MRYEKREGQATVSSKKPTMGKKFWQYIKSRKKDTINIAALINSSGEEVIDSKGKVDILNQQCDSVFTDENMLEIPELSDSSIPDIGKLTVTEIEVNKLLKNLDIAKAIGPDQIQSWVLKEAADQIKPFLTRIFNQGKHQQTGDKQTSQPSTKRDYTPRQSTTDQCRSCRYAAR